MMFKKTIIWIVLICSPFLLHSTHIVGGELNYVYNGGSSYTIKLKLYKDCGSGAAAFPGSVTISVRGYNGAVFSPSKDITINLGLVNNIPSGLAPCAVPPNPMPCVQEGIYSTTVNNLPPNPGGYHLYYQVTARNLSLTNINGACNCIGESFYANIPGTTVNTLWDEDFSLPNNTTIDNGPTSWSTQNGITTPATSYVNNTNYEITGSNNGSATWTSQNISIAACSSANLSVDLSENGTLDANDSISVFYRLNGGPLILFTNNGFKADDFSNSVATTNGLTGTNVQIVIRVKYDNNSPASEVYKFDNIVVRCINNDFKVNNNASFNLFPPLFLCVNQPFSFNHGATDANGDSLVYSLYTPYDGDGGTGPLDPTFTSNIASFSPVNYLTGFSTNNPLGSGAFSINSSTGVINGTPGMIGQFVVGVMVKEFRNGVFLSQTLRDFQFNILNCPQPPPTLAVPNATLNNGCSAKLTATGINSVSATWTSVFPGVPGAYNNYLACTSGCLSNTITSAPNNTPPPYIDYIICGTSTSCAGNYICDTFRVTFNSALAVNIFPSNPVLCSGQTSTTITAVGLGGTPPYNYLWNNSNPSQTINIGAGNFTIKLTDASGCPPVYNSVTVTAYTLPITANAGSDQIKCSQNPLTTLNGTVSGSSGGIWTGGQGVFNPNNTTLSNLFYTPSTQELAAGSATLFLTTTGNGACPSKTDTMIVCFQGFTGAVSSSITPVSCFSGSNGAAIVNVSGGTAPHSFNWNTIPPQTSSTATNLPSGIFNVQITNGIGCTTQTTVNISQPPPLNISQIITNASCSGANNGSISLTANGGTTPYSYVWLPGGQSSSSATNLSAGIYTANVADSKGCIKSTSFAVTQPSVITIAFTKTNVACFGGNTGIIHSSITGGTPPFSFSWSPNGATSQNLNSLTAGIYTLTVTDAVNCTKTNTIAITQSPALTLTHSVVSETCHYLNNGSATAIPSGGTPGYAYSWSPGNQTTATITNQPSGNYTVTITDLKGCQANAIATINEPPPLSVGFTNITHVACFGGSNGVVTASPNGGTPNYTYTWSPGGTQTALVNNLSTGIYTVAITDNNYCTASNTVSINQPIIITITNTTSPTLCNGGNNGSISLTTNGGTAPYSYVWLPGGQTTSSVTNLSAGIYTANVADSKGCIKSTSFAVTQPSVITIAFTKTNVACFGGNTGIIHSSITGGTPPFSFSWSPNGATSQNINSLTAGVYTLMVTDAVNCTKTNTIAITQSPALTLTHSVVNETCHYLNNGSATAIPSGGTPGYVYSWSPGNQTTATITNKPSGNYTVTITDSKGCQANAIATINEPPPLSVGFTNITNVACFGGNNGIVTASPNGGTPNYTYTWSPGNSHLPTINNLGVGIYTVSIKDSKSCLKTNTISITQPQVLDLVPTITNVTCNGATNGAVSLSPNGGTAPYTHLLMPGNISGANFSNLIPGTYSIITTDGHGCTDNATITINQPIDFSSVTSHTNSNCSMNNGSASISVTNGGTPPYTYSWLPAGGTSSVAINLTAGSYSVTTTDAAGCMSTKIVLISDAEGPIVSVISTTNVSCFGGSNGAATATYAGGTGPTFNYLWLSTGENTLTSDNLSTGTYLIKITDAAGCIGLATSPLITEPAPLSLNIVPAHIRCSGENNGSAIAIASGGTGIYNYNWSSGLSSGNSITLLSAGIYSLNVTDINNCSITSTFVIAEPDPLNLSLTSTSVTCNGLYNGSISSIASGGTGPYNFTCNPGNINDPIATNLSAGNYTVNVIDNNGCTISSTITVTEPTAIVLSTSQINSNCSLANGQVSVSASGGTGTYSYTWQPNGGSVPTLSGIPEGTYTVLVADENNCLANATQIVSDNASPLVSILSSTNVSCFGGSNGKAVATAIGGSAPFSYLWLPNGGNDSIASGLSTGIYTVLVTAANGCSVTAISPLIDQPNELSINIATTNVTCFGNNDGSATATAFGGTPGYSYNWTPGTVTTSTITNLVASNYSLQIKDANNCIKTTTINISQPNTVNISIITSSVLCYGGSNGNASAVITGGTYPYNYVWLPMGTTGSSVSNLTAGNYTLVVTDNNGCVTSNTFTIAEPSSPLIFTTNTLMPTCFGGSDGTASILPTGGTPGYTYNWSPITSSSSTVTNVSAGSYSVTITDLNGCDTHANFVISQPSMVTGSLTAQDASCGLANGSIQLQLSGGTGPYSYLWSPTSQTVSALSGIYSGTYTVLATDLNSCALTLTTSLINIAGPDVSLLSTNDVSCFGGSDGSAAIAITQGSPIYNINWLPYGGNAATATALAHGTYTVHVTDTKGCKDSISIFVHEPGPLNATLNSKTDVSCYNGQNGSASVLANGGSTPYTFTWSSGGNNSFISNLGSGTYSVSVIDNNNCMTSLSFIINQPSLLISSITNVTNPVCYNGTGNAAIQVSGGSAPYSYAWNNNPLQGGNSINNVSSGNYSVNVTDNNGCQTSNSVTISQPSQIVTSVISNDTICAGQTIQLISSANGGAGNYYYSWQPINAINSGTLTSNPTSNQSYTVVAFDQNGCAGLEATSNLVVYNFSSANINVAGTTPICPGQATNLYAQATGNTGQLNYTWSNNLGNTSGPFIVTPTQPTTYYLTATSSCGVSILDSLTITFNPPPTVLQFADTTTICTPGTINFSDHSLSGNPSDLISSWQWDFGDGTFSSIQNPSHQYSTPGTHTVNLTIKTDAGCIGSSTLSPVIINAIATPTASFYPNQNILNLPYDELLCTNTSQNADLYYWDFGDGTTSMVFNSTHQYETIGSHEVQLIASSLEGCSDTTKIVIETMADVVFPNAFTPGDQGESGGYYDFHNLDNNIFFPRTSGVVEYHLQIFNRWGELIFETKDIKQGWDGYYMGRPCETGVYIWKAKIKLNNDYLFKKAGDVTLLR